MAYDAKRKAFANEAALQNATERWIENSSLMDHFEVKSTSSGEGETTNLWSFIRDMNRITPDGRCKHVKIKKVMSIKSYIFIIKK